MNPLYLTIIHWALTQLLGTVKGQNAYSMLINVVLPTVTTLEANGGKAPSADPIATSPASAADPLLTGEQQS